MSPNLKIALFIAVAIPFVILTILAFVNHAPLP